jgi:hypothetical protein
MRITTIADLERDDLVKKSEITFYRAESERDSNFRPIGPKDSLL